jgi:hypothetical protein
MCAARPGKKVKKAHFTCHRDIFVTVPWQSRVDYQTHQNGKEQKGTKSNDTEFTETLEHLLKLCTHFTETLQSLVRRRRTAAGQIRGRGGWRGAPQTRATARE